MIENCLFVGIGGFLGSVLRYLLSLVPFLNRSIFPFQTLLANVAGAFLIGVIVGITDRCPSVNPQLVLMLKVGLCGGFTTFSTFSNESLSLIQDGKCLTAFAYISLSLALCITGVLIGKTLVMMGGKI